MKHYFHNILRLWKILKPFHLHFYVQLGFIFVTQLFVVVFAYITSQLLNNLVAKDIRMLVMFFIAWALLSCLEILIDYFARVNRVKNLDESLFSHLQSFSFRHLLSLTIAQHVEDHSALKLTIISKGETAVSYTHLTLPTNREV